MDGILNIEHRQLESIEFAYFVGAMELAGDPAQKVQWYIDDIIQAKNISIAFKEERVRKVRENRRLLLVLFVNILIISFVLITG